MASAYNQADQRPREWRRRVSIQARVRSGADWSDCRILNISSRGMMLQYSRPLDVGSEIEIRQQGRKVPATVIWRKGMCAGLACNQPIDTIEWLAASTDRGSAAVPPSWKPRHDRRLTDRKHEDSRQFARWFEYVAVAGFSAAIALGAAGLALTALLKPLAIVTKVLG